MKKTLIILLPLIFLLQCSFNKNNFYDETKFQIPLHEKITFDQYVDMLVKTNSFKKYPDINDIK